MEQLKMEVSTARELFFKSHRKAWDCRVLQCRAFSGKEPALSAVERCDSLEGVGAKG